MKTDRLKTTVAASKHEGYGCTSKDSNFLTWLVINFRGADRAKWGKMG